MAAIKNRALKSVQSITEILETHDLPAWIPVDLVLISDIKNRVTEATEPDVLANLDKQLRTLLLQLQIFVESTRLILSSDLAEDWEASDSDTD